MSGKSWEDTVFFLFMTLSSGANKFLFYLSKKIPLVLDKQTSHNVEPWLL